MEMSDDQFGMSEFKAVHAKRKWLLIATLNFSHSLSDSDATIANRDRDFKYYFSLRILQTAN